MPKKAPKNGYYYFMLEFRDREQAAGRRFPNGMADVAIAAAEDWKRLPQADKDDYNEYAKENRHNETRKTVMKKSERKFNSLGVSFAEMEREKRRKEEKELAITTFVHDFVASKNLGNLKEDYIHLIHVNIFCRTDDDVYYPAELAICRFNLQEGPIDVYHTFLAPGEIKKGYQYAVKERSEKFHKINLLKLQGENKYGDYGKICDEICSFLELKGNRSVPLFTMNDDVFHNTSFIAVERTMQTLWENKCSDSDSDEIWRKHVPVYPLPLLFYQLMKYSYLRTGAADASFPNSSVAATELHKDTYHYNIEFGCDFHQKEEDVMYCSRCYVVRWAHIMRDHCSVPLEIPLTKEDESDYDYYSTRTEGFHSGSECDNDEDYFTECGSVVSGHSARTTKTNLTDKNIGYFCEDDRPVDREGRYSSNVSQVSGASACTSSTWNKPRGRARLLSKASSASNDDFPTLGGVARGITSMNLNR